MRALIQRVRHAGVAIEGEPGRQIGPGLLVMLGIAPGDDANDIDWLCPKLINLRIFRDESGAMNLSLLDIHGELLLISQFTLFASTQKGNRPSFTKSAPPAVAKPLYEACLEKLRLVLPGRVACGTFGADMKITLLNDGPVSINIDTHHRE